MKNSNVIDKSIRDILRRELKEYEQTVGELTLDERKELHEWVKAGNSVRENPALIYGEDGGPMDYISAIMIIDDMNRNPDDYQWWQSVANNIDEDILLDNVAF